MADERVRPRALQGNPGGLAKARRPVAIAQGPRRQPAAGGTESFAGTGSRCERPPGVSLGSSGRPKARLGHIRSDYGDRRRHLVLIGQTSSGSTHPLSPIPHKALRRQRAK